jgi:uncharacterized phage-like protein YoqJ
MEITAAAKAVEALEGSLVVMSDSTYVVNCFRDRWWKGWIARGWKTSQRKPVANRDLWEPLIEAVVDRGDVEFRWVKAHDGDRWNELADRLAVEAARTQRSRSGPGTPQSVGSPDSSGSARAETRPAARPYSGRAVGVFGQRPAALGTEDSHLADRLRDRLSAIIAAKREMADDLVVVSGLRRGAEQLGAEAAIETGTPLAVVLPFPRPDSAWPAAARRRFAELAAAARDHTTLERTSPETPREVGAALARRDGWLVRNVDEAIVVGSRADPAIGKLIRALERQVGEDVWLVDPEEL